MSVLDEVSGFEIAVCAVDGGGGVVARDPVLGDQRGDGSFAVLVEQGVMAYAQTEGDIELGARFVEQLGLGDGVAHGLPGIGFELLLRGDAHLGFWDGAGFTDDGNDLKPLFSQDLCY